MQDRPADGGDNRRMSAPLPPLLTDEDAPLRVLLDPRGRISRRTFWLWGVLALGGLTLLLRALLEIARMAPDRAEGLVSLLLLWPAIAVSAKRWHDRDKSGWWVLIALVPVIGWLWMLIDNGFRRGTPNANRFGPAPP